MTAKRGGLNRGLAAFISDTDKIDNLSNNNEESRTDIIEESGGNLLTEIPLNQISTNPDQPRRFFDTEKLNELAESIRDHGVIQPIIVNKDDQDGYIIVAGERRYRASLIAGKDTIPAIVRNYDDFEKDKVTLIENIQRQDLNPYEEAMGYKSILDNYDITQQELADQLGKSRSYISNTIRLLKLDDRVLDLIKEDKLSYSMGRELLSIEDKEAQYQQALEIIDQGMSVSDLSKKKKKKPRKSSTVDKSVHVIELENNFEEVLGTKVSIDEKKQKISIDYYDNDDLERIIEIIIGG